MSGRHSARSVRFLALAAAATWAMLLGACASGPQRTFTTPEAAAEALIASAESDDLTAMKRILGPEAKRVMSTGDPVQDRNQRQIFVIAAQERWQLQDMENGDKELVIGYEDWPFPIPLVDDAGAWRWDTEAGLAEVIARRIGRNELSAIGNCLTYVTAQQEYAASGHDGRPAGLYAQRFRSTPGTQDGLYWDAAPSEPLSPLGPLAAEAADQGYVRWESGELRPFHGYYFRILTSQTAAAPDGARDYIVNGGMSGGFGLVAFPAVYGESGIMTFIVNQDGVVLERDLGERTDEIASAMTAFDPTDEWQMVD